MKQFFFGLLFFATVPAIAQQNVLLDKAFWEKKPGVAAVKAEIEKGNSPSEFNKMTFDPVSIAINNQAPNETIIFLLQQKGNEVNKLTHDARTYIFWAAAKGNIEIVKYLLANGADLKIKDSHGYTALAFTANGGQQDVAVYEALIAGGANIKERNLEGATTMHLAIPFDSTLKLTDYFITKGLSIDDVDEQENTVFNYAARGGNIALLELLLKRKVKYNDNAMLMAAMATRRTSNKVPVFKFLEALNIKPTVVNKHGDNALHFIAKKKDQYEAITYFIDKGVAVDLANIDGVTPLMNAAASSDVVAVNALLDKTKNINATDKKGATALSWALKSNTEDVVALLLKHSADVQVVDVDGNSLVHYLFESYKSRLMPDFKPKMTLLQAKGLDFSKAQKNGNNVYHLAIAINDLDLVKSVVAFNADVNAKNQEGITPLHKAAMVAVDDSILKFLIEKGALKTVVTNFDETAYALAKENEHLAKKNISVEFLK